MLYLFGGDLALPVLFQDAPSEMFWKTDAAKTEPYIRETPHYFSYTEKLDYTPVFIRVKTLLAGELSRGRHSLHWNAKDEQNRKVASGIYFYKLSTSTGHYTAKMMLMK